MMTVTGDQGNGVRLLCHTHRYTLVTRWSFFPGRFDYFFHSHQIWHVCVVAAAYCHLHTILSLMRWRLQSGVCPL